MKITFKGQTKDLKYYKGLKWDKPLTAKMEEFKAETGKNPVYRGAITGQYEYWLYWRKESTKVDTPDRLHGGNADNLPDSLFNKKELRKGRKIESEHTSNPKLQNEITKDHLVEIPDYNTRLLKMEEKAEKQIEKRKINIIRSYERKLIISRKNVNRLRKIIEKQKNYDNKKYYIKQVNQEEENIKHYKNKIIEHKLDFNKLNRLLSKSGLRKSEWRKGRVGGHFSIGYWIDKPTYDKPKIEIGWNSYQFAKKSDFEDFKKKIIPILKAYKFNYRIEQNKKIIIE